MKAAVYLGPDYTEHLEVYRNTNLEELQNLFDVTQSLKLHHQAEFLNVTPIDWTAPSWTRSAFTHDQVITWTKAKVRVYSDSVLCMEKCQCIQKRTMDGMLNSNNFNCPILAQNYLESMENWLSSSGIFSRTYFIGDHPEDPKESARSEHWNWKFLKNESSSCQCSTTSVGQREEFQKDVFQILNKSRIARKDSREDTGHSSAHERKRNDTELSATHLKENGIPSPNRWWNASKKLVTQYSRASVLWVVDFWKEMVAEIPYAAMRIHRTQNSCFAQFTQQISSVTTEQSQKVDFGKVRENTNCTLYWIQRRLMVFKSTLVVDKDTTVHGVHTNTVAFSLSVLTKCSVCSYHPPMRTLRMNGSRRRPAFYDT